MKTTKNKQAERALTEFENELNSPEAIKEKQFISELQLAFYANRGLPDDRFWWAASRRAVRRILKEAGLQKRPPATLFLRLHYPFFNDEVQSILMERHSDKCRITKDSPWYAVDAYLLAEQYSLTAYGDDLMKNLNLIEGVAQFYFVHDLRWFSRLLVSVADVFELMRRGLDPETVTVTLRLQEWNSRYSEVDKTPGRWLEGTEYLANAKPKDSGKSASSRGVTASKENKRRNAIFQTWLPCWRSDIERLDILLNASSSKH